MKKSIYILLAIVFFVGCLALTSCNEKSTEITGCRYPNTPLGFKFQLSEAVLQINQKLTPAKEKANGIPNMTVTIDIKGQEELLYFDATVTFLWTYRFVNDRGVLEEATQSVTVELDIQGNANYKEKIQLTGHSSVEVISLDVSFSGYAVKNKSNFTKG